MSAHSRSCLNSEFIQRWQAATFFSFKHPFTDASQQSYLFPLPPYKREFLTEFGGLGTSQSAWSKKSEVLSYCDPSIRMISQQKRGRTFCPQHLVFQVVKRGNQRIFKTTWITPLIHKGARLLKVALIRVSANKQKFSRFRFSKAIRALWCRLYCKQTENYTKIQHSILERLNVFIPYLHSKSPKNPCRTKRELAMITSQEMRKA